MNTYVAPIWRTGLAKFLAVAVTFAAIAAVPATTMVIEPASVGVARRAYLASATVLGEQCVLACPSSRSAAVDPYATSAGPWGYLRSNYTRPRSVC